MLKNVGCGYIRKTLVFLLTITHRCFTEDGIGIFISSIFSRLDFIHWWASDFVFFESVRILPSAPLICRLQSSFEALISWTLRTTGQHWVNSELYSSGTRPRSCTRCSRVAESRLQPTERGNSDSNTNKKSLTSLSRILFRPSWLAILLKSKIWPEE